MKTSEIRLMVAIAVSVLIIVAYPHIVAKIFPQYTRIQKTTNIAKTPQKQAAAPALNAQHIEKKEDKAIIPAEEPLMADEKLITLENAQYKIVCSNLGGAIKEIYLKKYTDPDKQQATQLIAVNDSQGAFMLYNIMGSNELHEKLYSEEKISNGIEYSYSDDTNLKIVKRFILDPGKYTIKLEIDFTNLTDKNLAVSYDLISGKGMPAANGVDAQFYEIDTLMQDNKRFHDHEGGIRNSSLSRYGAIKWAALKNRYFSLITMPAAEASSINLSKTAQKELISRISMSNFNIIPLASTTHEYFIYAGPNDVKLLKAADPRLDDVVAYGMFSGIGKLLMLVLEALQRVFRNWGLAIIALAVLVNFIMYPLTRKSMHSMKEIQLLQPKIKALQEQYKNNAKKLNQEMLELYRTHKVNPLGGCLPMLLQMPVFIALYQVLLRAVELRNAGFLWIKNLAGPDAFITLGQKLPIIGEHINLLPILMAVVMFFQQKTSTAQTALTAEQKQQQQIMLVMMPVMFGFIFYNFASGVVLYWFTNTIMTTIIQKKILVSPRRIP